MRGLMLAVLIGALDGPWHGSQASVLLRPVGGATAGGPESDRKPAPYYRRQAKQWEKG